ncbi:TVP38/TMEM64 family protein [Pseudactinotalea sp. Z1739]|uniref:TVP38/TMEM64 family protein n=1 Tax=Pseudactinotalea sp. Z1739 TaxID=3413028 RepID=UPI003C7C2265
MTVDERGVQAPPGSGPQWGVFLRNAALVVVVLVMLWLAFNVRLPAIEDLREGLEQWGWAARIVFAVSYALVATTPIPVSIMAVSAGVLFGVLEGSILSVIGVLAGCWGAYWLARGLGMATVERMLGRHGPTVKERLSSKGFHAVYTLRLMPGVPYWPVNYGSGAFGVGQRDFVVASMLATVPGQVSLVAVGAFAADPTVVSGVVVAIAWAVVLAMTIWAWRSWRGTSRRPLPGAGLR